MITATGYVLRCEHAGCEATMTDLSRHRLQDWARDKGWSLGVRLNGQRALKGGKDYCPEHVPAGAR